jgi:outer membrane receptor protein involved in Fe transport
VTLTWHPAREQMLYAAYKTGYKSGGIANTAVIAAATPASALRFGPEKSEGFEIGYKGELLDRKLRLALTAYRYNYRGLQVSIYDPTTISYQLRNAANARVQGVEAEASWISPIHGLEFNGSFNYNDAHYISFPDAQCYSDTAPGCSQNLTTGAYEQNLAGQPLLRAPKVSFNLGADYTTESIIQMWTVTMHVDGKYTSRTVVNETNDPLQTQKPYWLLNASLKFGPTNGHYDFAVIGRNLTNTHYMIYSSALTFGDPGVYAAFVNRPREVALQAEVHF